MQSNNETIQKILARKWSPDSWQSLTASQQPIYPDDAAVRRVVERLSKLPPLVTSWEIENLKQQLADAAEGNSFLLQGGECFCLATALVPKGLSGDAAQKKAPQAFDGVAQFAFAPK